jgi:hypothetical protein
MELRKPPGGRRFGQLFISHAGVEIDWALQYTTRFLHIIDAEIALLSKPIRSDVDLPDDFYWDQIDMTIGFGFVACQQYLKRPAGYSSWSTSKAGRMLCS